MRLPCIMTEPALTTRKTGSLAEFSLKPERRPRMMNEQTLPRRPLGNTGLQVSPLGFGAFKIGRNQGIKYPQGYDLPDESTVEKLLNQVLDLGINLIDTAPAYGLSEERIGKFLSPRREEFVLSTKVGEMFEEGISHYDYSETAVRASLERSFERLQTDTLDVVFIHSNGEDLHILNETPTVKILQEYQSNGRIRAIGMSGKTVEGAREALSWADVLMVEYHLNDTSHSELIQEAAEKNVAVFIKKGLAAGHLSPEESIRFILQNPGVTSLVLGGLNPDHLKSNIAVAAECFD